MDKYEVARKHALINALEHKGKANSKAVFKKVLGEREDLKKNLKETFDIVKRVVDEINKMEISEQKKALENFYPQYFEKGKKEKKGLPPLPKVGKRVVTRLPPEPNGYLHLGHGLSFYFNYYYAKIYNGEVILRFDDTNPKNERLEYYKAIKEDLEWLKISWDREHNMSDDMELYYEFAEKMIGEGNVYVCVCSKEKVRKKRFEGVECGCRKNSEPENQRLWEEMLSGKKYILRLKGDMKSENTVMRDPTLFRIIEEEHPIQKNKYKVWPTYDFACAVEDSILGITHVLRSNEFHLRIELQNYIRELLSLRHPTIIEYSKFKIKGSPTSKRLIKPLIEKGIVDGYSDPRLVTLRGLRRRGIIPETIHHLAEEIGLSTAEPEIDRSIFEAINRKLIDSRSKRYFFVPNPVKVKVKNAPEINVELKLHPSSNLGVRRIRVSDTFYLPKEDLRKGVLRLKDLYNIKILKLGEEVLAEYAGKKLIKNVPKIQWVTEENLKIKVLVFHNLFEDSKFNKNSLEIVEGVGEKALENIKVSEIVQFERFGFCRFDGGNTFIFAHR